MSVLRAVVRRCSTNSCLFNVSVNTLKNAGVNSRFEITTTLLPTLRRSYSSSSSVKIAGSHIKTETNDENSAKNDANTDERVLIYTGALNRNVRLIKAFSLSTSLVGIGIQPVVYAQAVAQGTVTAFTLPLFALIGMFALATPPLLHYITKRYILDVEYDPKEDKYIASVYNLFAIKRKIEFTPEDVTIPAVLGMFATCAIKGKPMLLDAKCFNDQSHYIRIMGYDKPLDLQVEEEYVKESAKKDTTTKM